jgi:hypothetical protein
MDSEAETGPTGLLTSDVVAQLEDQVRLRLGGRVLDFRLSIRDMGLVLKGRTRSYHAKQLAQEALMDMTGAQIRANEIEVY